jgi:hypothetical protein
MTRAQWKPYQVLEALELLATIPTPEHALINAFLDRPYIPAKEGLNIVRNLTGQSGRGRADSGNLRRAGDQS